MKALALAALTFAGLAGMSGCSTTRSDGPDMAASAALSPQDDAAVRATIAALDEAWNRQDMEGLRALFTEDAVWIRTSGNTWRGRKSIFINYQVTADRPSLATENIELRAVAPQVVVAVAVMKYGELLRSSGEVAPSFHNRASLVMVKSSEGWKICHLHKVGLVPAVEQSDPFWGKPR